MDEKIKEKDHLKGQDEASFLDIMVDLATNQSYNLTDGERDAIVAIRKELLRKNMTIERQHKNILKLDKYNQTIEKENEQLSDNLLRKAELARQYQRIIDKMKRQSLDAQNRNTYLELKA